MLHINGYPDRPPVRAAVPVTDMVTALYGALGATMALLSRGRTGQGQVVDAALYESAFSLMESHVPAFEKLGHVAMRAGTHLPGSTPNSLYPTADGGFIAMAASSDAVFRRLAQVMGQAELANDPRFATGLARVENEEVLDGIIAEWTGGFELGELAQLLQTQDVPGARVFTMADIFRDPHFAARGTIIHAPDKDLGTVAMPAPAPRLSATPGLVRHAGGVVGEDTVQVLSTLGEFSADEIAQLLQSGAAFDAAHTAASRATQGAPA
jgi:crotonobetainyl-CoA:carnitine CoA-transferase CaiB-like acyl-CoA transferase